MIRLTRRYRFSASHRLHIAQFSDERNSEIYGKCNNPYGHGHNYVFEISIHGDVDPRSGQLARVETLDALVALSVLRDFSERNLNQDVPDFLGNVPTTENIAVAIEKRLQANWKDAFPDGQPRLDSVRVRETRNNSFELKIRRPEELKI